MHLLWALHGCVVTAGNTSPELYGVGPWAGIMNSWASEFPFPPHINQKVQDTVLFGHFSHSLSFISLWLTLPAPDLSLTVLHVPFF